MRNKTVFSSAISVLGLLFCGHIVMSQSNPAETSVSKELIQIEQNLVTALLQNNPIPFEANIVKTATITGPDGVVMTREELVNAVKSVKYTSIDLKDVKVKIYGEVAIVTYQSTEQLKDATEATKNRWTDTFVKSDGKWQIVAMHGSTLAEP